MKTMKSIACLAIGLVTLGIASSQAANVGPLSISITSTVPAWSDTDNVTTFSTSKMAINNASIIAKVSECLGMTFPAGAKLAVAATSDAVNGTDPGDVVIVNVLGGIILNLTQGIENETGDVFIGAGAYAEACESKVALKSTTTVGKGEGWITFYLYKRPVWNNDDVLITSGEEIQGWFWDNLMSGQYARGKAGQELTTGTVNFAGAGEIWHWTNIASEDSQTLWEPANCIVGASATSVPWVYYPFKMDVED